MPLRVTGKVSSRWCQVSIPSFPPALVSFPPHTRARTYIPPSAIETPLHLACRDLEYGKYFVPYLLRCGALPFVRDHEQRTTFHVAAGAVLQSFTVFEPGLPVDVGQMWTMVRVEIHKTSTTFRCLLSVCGPALTPLKHTAQTQTQTGQNGAISNEQRETVCAVVGSLACSIVKLLRENSDRWRMPVSGFMCEAGTLLANKDELTKVVMGLITEDRG